MNDESTRLKAKVLTFFETNIGSSDMPKIDIIIPFYNSKIEFTREALLSVIGQTLSDWRIILINDGSSYESTIQIEQLIDELNDDRIVYQKTKNQGVACTRNYAISISTAPYIAFLDQDDFWYPTKLEKQIKLFENEKNACLVFSDCDKLLANNQTVQYRQKNKPDFNELSQDELIISMLHGNFIPLVTVIIRRETINEIGAFDGNFGGVEDKELWLKILIKNKKIKYLHESLAVHRLHSSNQSKNIEQIKQDRLRLINKIDIEISQDLRLMKICNWKKEKKKMIFHVYHEVVEGYLENNQNKKAIYYCFPKFSGLSIVTIKLIIRTIFRFAVKQS